MFSDLFVEAILESFFLLFFFKVGTGGGRGFIPYKERNDRGGEKGKKKKMTMQRIRETIQVSPETERKKNNEGDTEEV